ncbi:hypothetical protein FS749_012902 [Ceratobasidium sp. UAMH 11750]|nr:hypothetical protein FS749_012902 [Ceratobasidium sp. UAMH 11750]
MCSRGPSPTPSHSPGSPLLAPTDIPSRMPSPAPSNVASVATSNSNPAPARQKDPDARRNMRKTKFTEIQNDFIDYMTRRWQWFLLTENAFPVDTTGAYEVCVAYAETMLESIRAAAEVNKRVFEYVRGKDSRIRNDFQRGVLTAVEELYQVSCNNQAKVKELIKDSNFVFETYDPNSLKVTGRYRHACISTVARMAMFPQLARGRSPGVRFIRELLARTPPELVAKYCDKRADYGASAPLIALSCTLILHALHSLAQGYSSKDQLRGSAERKKALPMDERTYRPLYHTFLLKLESYKRLGEVRQFHMKVLLKEYCAQQPDGSVDVSRMEPGNEKHSDGE